MMGPIVGDNSTLPLSRRISTAVKYVLDNRLGRSVTVEKVIVYHTSAYTHTVRTKSFVSTTTEVYSVKASFDKDSAFFRRLEVNLEIPRGRQDFRVEIVHGQRRKIFVIPYLGDMQLPAILAERDDTMPPDDLAETLKSMVLSGNEGWREMPVSQIALTDDEIELVQKYLRLSRFEGIFRKCLVSLLTGTYGVVALERVSEILGIDAERVSERVKASAARYGAEAGVVDLPKLFDNLGFEHYIRILEDAGVWSKCLSSVFKDQPQTVEGLKVIRDARNEISHFRDTAHPGLWAGASMYLDALEGRIRMTDPSFRKLVGMVQRSGAGSNR